MKDTIMNATHNILSKINAIQESKWIRPALMMLALLVAVLGLTGCHKGH